MNRFFNNLINSKSSYPLCSQDDSQSTIIKYFMAVNNLAVEEAGIISVARL
jgi:hypothetical protein